jgi:hypothetical protein
VRSVVAVVLVGPCYNQVMMGMSSRVGSFGDRFEF